MFDDHFMIIFIIWLQVHSPCGAAPLIGGGMGPHFIFAEDGETQFREAAATDIRRCHMHRHHVHTFNCSEADDVLSSHKLLKPLSTGKFLFHLLYMYPKESSYAPLMLCPMGMASWVG